MIQRPNVVQLTLTEEEIWLVVRGLMALEDDLMAFEPARPGENEGAFDDEEEEPPRLFPPPETEEEYYTVSELRGKVQAALKERWPLPST